MLPHSVMNDDSASFSRITAFQLLLEISGYRQQEQPHHESTIMDIITPVVSTTTDHRKLFPLPLDISPVYSAHPMVPTTPPKTLALLTDIPPELLDQVLDNLRQPQRQSTLFRLSLVSRGFHAHVQPRLYSDVYYSNFTGDSRPDKLPSGGNLRKLLRTIITRPDLASLVKKLEVGYRNRCLMGEAGDNFRRRYEQNVEYQKDLELFTGALAAVGLNDSIPDGIQDYTLSSGGEEMLLVLLIALLPNMEHLRMIPYGFSEGTPIEKALWQLALRDPTKQRRGGQNLRRIEIGLGYKDSGAMSTLRSLAPFLAFPRIESLEASLASVSQFFYPVALPKSPDSWPIKGFAGPPYWECLDDSLLRTSDLATLSLSNTLNGNVHYPDVPRSTVKRLNLNGDDSIEYTSLTRLLHATLALDHLSVEYLLINDTPDLLDFRKALEPHARSLHTLRVVEKRGSQQLYEGGYINGLGSLLEFAELKHLGASVKILLGNGGRKHGPRLHEILPTLLSTLELYGTSAKDLFEIIELVRNLYHSMPALQRLHVELLGNLSKFEEALVELAAETRTGCSLEVTVSRRLARRPWFSYSDRRVEEIDLADYDGPNQRDLWVKQKSAVQRNWDGIDIASFDGPMIKLPFSSRYMSNS